MHALNDEQEIVTTIVNHLKLSRSALINYLSNLNVNIPMTIMDINYPQGKNILHILLEHCDDLVCCRLFFSKLDIHTIEALMLRPNTERQVPLVRLLTQFMFYEKNREPLVRMFLEKTSDECLNKLLNMFLENITVLEFIIFNKNFSRELVNFILLRADKHFLYKVMTDNAALCYINYEDYKKAVRALNLYRSLRTTNFSVFSCKYPIVYNLIRSEIGVQETRDVSACELYYLDTDNLTRYIIQHPEVSIHDLKKITFSSPIFHKSYLNAYHNRLQTAVFQFNVQYCIVEILLKHFLSFSGLTLLIEYIVGEDYALKLIERVKNNLEHELVDFSLQLPLMEEGDNPSDESVIGFIKNNIYNERTLARYLCRLNKKIPHAVADVVFPSGNILCALMENNLWASETTFTLLFKKMDQVTIDQLIVSRHTQDQSVLILLFFMCRNNRDLVWSPYTFCTRMNVLLKSKNLFKRKREEIIKQCINYISPQAISYCVASLVRGKYFLDHMLFAQSFLADTIDLTENTIKNILCKIDKNILCEIMLEDPKTDSFSILCYDSVKGFSGYINHTRLVKLAYESACLYNVVRKIIGFPDAIELSPLELSVLDLDNLKLLRYVHPEISIDHLKLYNYSTPLNAWSVYRYKKLLMDSRHDINTHIKVIFNSLDHYLSGSLKYLVLSFIADEPLLEHVRNIPKPYVTSVNTAFSTNAPTEFLQIDNEDEINKLEDILQHSSKQDIDHLKPLAIVFEIFKKQNQFGSESLKTLQALTWQK